MLLLIQPLQDLLTSLHLLLGVIQEIHLKSSVFGFLIDLSSHLPIVEGALLKSEDGCLVDGLQISKTGCQLLANKMILQLLAVLHTQSVVFSFPPPVIKHIF